MTFKFFSSVPVFFNILFSDAIANWTKELNWKRKILNILWILTVNISWIYCEYVVNILWILHQTSNKCHARLSTASTTCWVSPRMTLSRDTKVFLQSSILTSHVLLHDDGVADDCTSMKLSVIVNKFFSFPFWWWRLPGVRANTQRGAAPPGQTREFT